MFHGEKSKKEKMKIKTQNYKIVETDKIKNSYQCQEEMVQWKQPQE